MPAIQAHRPLTAWPWHFLSIYLPSICVGLVFAISPAHASAQPAVVEVSAREAADDLEDAAVLEYLPGLVGRYQLDAQTLTRLDADIHFVGSQNANDLQFAIDDRFPYPPFHLQRNGVKWSGVTWSGAIDSNETGAYRLSAFVSGRFQLSINGKLVLEGDTTTPQWFHASQPIELAFGKHPLNVEFARNSGSPGTTGSGNNNGSSPAIGLYWSGPGFGLEPITAKHLFHRQADTPEESHTRGLMLSRGLRCNACHQFERRSDRTDPLRGERELTTDADVSLLSAPALTHVADNLRPSWLVERLMESPKADAASLSNSRMPHFALHRNDAAAISAALFEVSEQSAAPVFRTEADAQIGKILFASKGCVACHQSVQDNSQADSIEDESLPGIALRNPAEELFSGGDLSQIAVKRSRAFFIRWLADPASVNQQHRMPIFDLTLNERHDLAAYLTTLGADESRNDTRAAGDSRRGMGLIEQHRCGACHALPGALVQAQAARAKSQLSGASDWTSGCLSAPQPQQKLPGFQLSPSDRQALRRYLTDPLTLVAPENAQQLIAENNCLACHARGLEPGISQHLAHLVSELPELAPRLAAAVPPSLTSVGDKLHARALEDAIIRTHAPRRPWLDVQMPKFKLSKEQVQRIVGGLISQDRIPDQGAATLNLQAHVAAETGDHDTNKAEEKTSTHHELNALDDQSVALLAGRLVTAEGFGCQSCHQIGDSLPLNVALNAQGSDLTQLGGRIRASWFQRWVRNPARIVPRMEMPAIQVATPGLLHDSLDQQLEALWRVLNASDFQPPKANPVRIVRQRNDMDQPAPAHVLTDVLETPERTYLRPLIFGLSNRHNLLFDLERGQLAQWWIGDTAHQHTRGKSWLWNAGAAALVSQEFLERFKIEDEQGRVFEPTVNRQVAIEFDSVAHRGQGILWRGTVHLAAYPQENNVLENEVHENNKHANELYAHDSQPDDPFRRILTIAQELTMDPAGGLNVTTQLTGLEPGDKVQIESSGAFVADAQSLRYQFDLLNSVEFASVSGAIKKTQGGDLALTPFDEAGEVGWSSAYRSQLPPDRIPTPQRQALDTLAESLDCVPGFAGLKLPLPSNEMPIALAWGTNTALYVGSLKGNVLRAVDSDEDGELDQYERISDVFPTPYGLHANPDGSVDALTKFGLIRLRQNGTSDPIWDTQVIADGWGYTSDYHDWAVGLRQDRHGNYWMTLPCQQDKRSAVAAHWRGHALKLIPNSDSQARRLFRIESFAAGLRFPMGIALNKSDELFASDNQGNYNPFNELNHLRAGKRYGFINQQENQPGFNPPLEAPAVNLPHPWTRSVNGICFLNTPESLEGTQAAPHFGPFEGHLLGCEMNGRSLIRMSLQKVGETYQGAAYPFSRTVVDGEPTFEGPIVCEISPSGDIYVGNLKDSGWGGGHNTGSIVRLKPTGRYPLGIAEVRATPSGFEVDFTQPIDASKGSDPQNYLLRSYQRLSTPAYGGDDQAERTEVVQEVVLSGDRRSVALYVGDLREGFVYELNVAAVGVTDQAIFPSQAHYTLRHIPH